MKIYVGWDLLEIRVGWKLLENDLGRGILVVANLLV